MFQKSPSAAILPLFLLLSIASGHEHPASTMSEHNHQPAISSLSSNGTIHSEPVIDTYWAWPENGSLLYAHIFFMIVSWVFLMPVALALALARNRFQYVLNLLFVLGNTLGAFCASLYSAQTPDLYPNNSHTKLGWILIVTVTAQAVAGIISWRARTNNGSNIDENAQTPYSPVGVFVVGDEETDSDRAWSRSSRDSGFEGTVSPIEREFGTVHLLQSEEDVKEKPGKPSRMSKLFTLMGRIFPKSPNKTFALICEFYYMLVFRALPILGFIQICTGLVVVTGIFQGSNVFNGLAHFIKGGIFFWYGILTLLRWLGILQQYGWAWNYKPQAKTRWATWFPTAEMVESSLILLYGTIDSFLEHLAAWGHEWTHMDLEHVAIAVLFFGGGLAGVLTESKYIRGLLNESITSPAHRDRAGDADETLKSPRTYKYSYNPFPALVIFLVGQGIGSHHQHSELSVTIHRQWGLLLSCAAISRGATYLLLYLQPPKSLLPSRPPTELISAFCLMGGGLILMMSNKDTVAGMDRLGIDAGFSFTIMSAFTAFLMAWVVVVMAVKGWGIRHR